ncbi:MAG: tetratricopeptide repeat protein [Candidatus Micrarchaeota archaeon]|nr:tetratricopeptide repeat protein [Candidatus Micrarchaeota archaeon]
MKLSQTIFPEIPSKSPGLMNVIHARAVSKFAQRPLQDETAIDVSRTLMQSAKYNLTKGRDSRASRRLASAISLLEEQQAIVKPTDHSANTYGLLAGMLADSYFRRGDIKYSRAESSTLRNYERKLCSNFEGAIEDYTKAIEYVSINPSAYNSRGSAKFMLGKYEDAIADFDQAIFQDQECAAAYFNRGNAKYHLH